MLTEIGNGICATRNALCFLDPKATIHITDINAGKPPAGESPHKCR